MDKQPKKRAAKKAPTTKPTALTISELNLNQRQLAIVHATTPAEFIKSKPARGGKMARYVEGGYVIAKLNEAFGPLNWEFVVKERGTTDRKTEKNTDGEVWVYAELSVLDHKHGYRASKGQFGQHPIHNNVPTGDAFKAAETDALKKCASMLGIALDVYWREMDMLEAPRSAPARPANVNNLFTESIRRVRSETSVDILMEWFKKTEANKALAPKAKAELIKAINGRITALTENA